MSIRSIVAAEPREHLAERHARTPAIVQRETRFVIRLRLPPQLLALAELSERVQQSAVVAMLRQPAFGRLELARRVGQPALGIERHELRVPMALEALRENVGCLAVRTER